MRVAFFFLLLLALSVFGQQDGPENPPGDFVDGGTILTLSPTTVTFASTDTEKQISVTARASFVYKEVYLCKAPCKRLQDWTLLGVFDGTVRTGNYLDGRTGLTKSFTLRRDQVSKRNNFITLFTCQGAGLCNNRKWLKQKFTVDFQDECQGKGDNTLCSGGICRGNTCVKCTTDTNCRSAGKYCDVPSGLCVSCLNNAQCPPACDSSGEICQDQYCYQPTKTCGSCATNDQCAGRVCDNGNCRNCQMSADCGGKQCDTASGKCVDCLTDSNCPSGKRCNQASKQCYTDCLPGYVTCPTGKVCDRTTTRCVDCVFNIDCPDFGLCTNNVCTRCTTDAQCAPYAGALCSSVVKCINGGCRIRTGYMSNNCKVGEESAYHPSLGNACCYRLCATDANCLFGQACTNYNCRDITLPVYTSCTSNTQCRTGLASGKCVCGHTNDVGASCPTPSGVSCQCSGSYSGATICIAVQRPCTSNAECQSGQRCDAPTKICVPLCSGVSCPSGQKCNPADGSCVPACTGVACPSGQKCNPSDGSCVPLCTGVSCPPGQQCNPQTGSCENTCAGKADWAACGTNGYCRNQQCVVPFCAGKADGTACASEGTAYDGVCQGNLCSRLVSGTQTMGTFAALTQNAAAGTTYLVVDTVSGFRAGDKVLIQQSQADIESRAGIYDIKYVASISGNVLVLAAPLVQTFTVGGVNKAQVVRVLRSEKVNVLGGSTLTANGWDGTKGGIIAIDSKMVTVDGRIDMVGKGFRRGLSYCNLGSNLGGRGESWNGQIASGCSANNGGGGGGDGVTNSGSQLLPSSGYTQSAAGGGGGGYGTVGAAGSNGVGWFCSGVGGSGGGTYGGPNTFGFISRINFGSGGGGGGGNQGWQNRCGATGGEGGGIIVIMAQTMAGAGIIDASGLNGYSSQGGGGGGGAGGSIRIMGPTTNPATRVTGGSGGSGARVGGAGGSGRLVVLRSGML